MFHVSAGHVFLLQGAVYVDDAGTFVAEDVVFSNNAAFKACNHLNHYSCVLHVQWQRELDMVSTQLNQSFRTYQVV